MLRDITIIRRLPRRLPCQLWAVFVPRVSQTGLYKPIRADTVSKGVEITSDCAAYVTAPKFLPCYLMQVETTMITVPN